MFLLRKFSCFVILALAWQTSFGEPPSQVETTWPGVFVKVADIKSLPGNRLLVLVRLTASASAPASTMISPDKDLPPNASQEQKENFVPAPFSLAASTMTDEQTGNVYHPVPADPKDLAYAPLELMSRLARGKSLTLAVRFAFPPPPPPGPDGQPQKQTVSFQFPNAKGSIGKMSLPAPSP